MIVEMNKILKIAILYSIVLAVSALSIKKENDTLDGLENHSEEIIDNQNLKFTQILFL